jgi:hypothetical protein
MAMGALTKLLLFLAASLETRALYYPLREYSGSTFFDKWDYYGFVDNTTWGESHPVFSFRPRTYLLAKGNVTYQDQANATSKGLTFINAAGNAIIKVDNTTTLAAAPPGTVVNRDSVRFPFFLSFPLP